MFFISVLSVLLKGGTLTNKKLGWSGVLRGGVYVADANGHKDFVLVTPCVNCVPGVPGGDFNTCRNSDGMGGGEAGLAEAVLRDFYVVGACGKRESDN